MDGERVEECLQAAMRAGGNALNTSRLNIVGEGRAGKTAWLRAVSNLPYKETDSTIGVQQTLLEVNKPDMKLDSDGRSWAIVEDGSGAIMKVEEAQKRLAAEIALQETPEERRLREERRQKAAAAEEEKKLNAEKAAKAKAEKEAATLRLPRRPRRQPKCPLNLYNRKMQLSRLFCHRKRACARSTKYRGCWDGGALR